MSSFCKCKSYSHFFSAKILAYMATIFNDQSFNKLTNDIVSFEQLGPDIFLITPWKHMLWVVIRSAFSKHFWSVPTFSLLHKHMLWYTSEAQCRGTSNEYQQHVFITPWRHMLWYSSEVPRLLIRSALPKRFCWVLKHMFLWIQKKKKQKKKKKEKKKKKCIMWIPPLIWSHDNNSRVWWIQYAEMFFSFCHFAKRNNFCRQEVASQVSETFQNISLFLHTCLACQKIAKFF